MFMCWQNCIA